MRSMAEEKRQKTDQLLMTAPVSLWKIVLGKYLAMVTIFLIPMAILCLYPLILLQFGRDVYKRQILNLQFLLFCCMMGLIIEAFRNNVSQADSEKRLWTQRTTREYGKWEKHM